MVVPLVVLSSKMKLAFLLLAIVLSTEAKLVCFDGAGCFSNDPPWNHLPLPQDPKGREVKYLLLQKDKPIREVKTVDELQFDNLMVFTHGFGGSYNSTTSWNAKITSGLHEVRPTADILFVDWEQLAKLIISKNVYHQAASNVRVVAAVVARWLKANPNFDSTKIHCLGFSLGAHVCGLTAKQLGTKWGRLTAIDPAAVGFRDDDPTTRVDIADGIYVDVMHVSWASLKRRLGHKDFYVNDANFQPGCPRNTRFYQPFGVDIWQFLNMFGCSHYRAAHLFGHTIVPDPDCTFRFCKCQSKQHFEKGYCRDCADENSAFLGYRSIESNATGEFYGITTGRKPYCAK